MKTAGEALYKTFTEVRCPYFGENVYFNTQGLEHLKFKGHGRARLREDQFMRLKLIRYAPQILQKSHTLQGLWQTKSFERVRVHNRTDTVMKNIEYYEFISVVDGKRIKVIVKRIDQGQRFFWSIIPYWKITTAGERKLHNGSPDED